MSLNILGLNLPDPIFPIRDINNPIEASITKYDEKNGVLEFTTLQKRITVSLEKYTENVSYPSTIVQTAYVYDDKYELNSPTNKVFALKVNVPAVYYSSSQNTFYSYNNRFLPIVFILSTSTFSNKRNFKKNAISSNYTYLNQNTGEINKTNYAKETTYQQNELSSVLSFPTKLSDKENSFKNLFSRVSNLPNKEYLSEKIWDGIENFCNIITNSNNGTSKVYASRSNITDAFTEFNTPTYYYDMKTTLPTFNVSQGEECRNYITNGTESLFDGTGTPENINDIKIATQDISFNTNWGIYLNTSTIQTIFTWYTSAFSENDIDTKNAYIRFYDDNNNIVTSENYEKGKKVFNTDELNSYLKKQFEENGYFFLKFYVECDNRISSTGYAKIESVITEYGIEEPNDGSTITLFYNDYPKLDTDYNDNGDVTDENIINGSTLGGGESSYNALNVISRTYHITTSNLRSLSNFLWSDNFINNIKLLTNDPIENIVSCKMMPFVLNGSEATIVCGNVDTGVKAESIGNNYYTEIGSINIPKYYHNFLDYAPYTKLTIFLPFIGFKELDCNLYIDKSLKVNYIHDLITGTCKAMLYANNIYVQSFDGVSGIDIPLTASNNSAIANAFINSAAGSIAQFFGDPIGGLISLGKATVSSALATQHYSTQGSYSPSCGAYETHVCYVIIDRPAMQYSATYNHDYGRPCNLSQTIGNLKGFTKMCENIDCSGISCTENEKEMIRQLLTSGIYV